MKNILFMIKDMNIGGVEKSLISLLNKIDRNKYNISLLLLEKKGGFSNSIPKDVEVLKVRNYYRYSRYINLPPRKIIKDEFKCGSKIYSFRILLGYIKFKVTNNLEHYYNIIYKNLESIPNKYDIAIAYQGPMDFISYYIVKKINAKKRIQWIHFDIEKIDINKGFLNKILKYYNEIFVVSNEGKDKFIKMFPKYEKKIFVKENIIDTKEITRMADEGVSFDAMDENFKILTVGRLAEEKGQDLAIRVLERLINDGYKVKWFCVGEGDNRSELENEIEKYNLKDKFILLGAKENPYGYIKDCDLYVQPSRQEGFCISLAEAKIFDKNILSTNFTGALEQLIDYRKGQVVNINVDEIYSGIKKLLVMKGCKNA